MQEGRCTTLMGLVLQGTDTAQQLKERFKNRMLSIREIAQSQGKTLKIPLSQDSVLVLHGKCKLAGSIITADTLQNDAAAAAQLHHFANVLVQLAGTYFHVEPSHYIVIKATAALRTKLDAPRTQSALQVLVSACLDPLEAYCEALCKLVEKAAETKQQLGMLGRYIPAAQLSAPAPSYPASQPSSRYAFHNPRPRGKENFTVATSGAGCFKWDGTPASCLRKGKDGGPCEFAWSHFPKKPTEGHGAGPTQTSQQPRPCSERAPTRGSRPAGHAC